MNYFISSLIFFSTYGFSKMFKMKVANRMAVVSDPATRNVNISSRIPSSLKDYFSSSA